MCIRVSVQRNHFFAKQTHKVHKGYRCCNPQIFAVAVITPDPLPLRGLSPPIIIIATILVVFVVINTRESTPWHPMGRLHPSRYIWRGALPPTHCRCHHHAADTATGLPANAALLPCCHRRCRLRAAAVLKPPPLPPCRRTACRLRAAAATTTTLPPCCLCQAATTANATLPSPSPPAAALLATAALLPCCVRYVALLLQHTSQF
jgi:hypothetical protein